MKCLLLAACALLYASSAYAQSNPCGPRDAIAKSLAERFQEAQAARGLMESGKHIMELFISPNGSWTILVTDDQKRSCVAMGHTEGFEFVAPELPKTGQGT